MVSLTVGLRVLGCEICIDDVYSSVERCYCAPIQLAVAGGKNAAKELDVPSCLLQVFILASHTSSLDTDAFAKPQFEPLFIELVLSKEEH